MSKKRCALIFIILLIFLVVLTGVNLAAGTVSLKLSEIELVTRLIGDKPVLMLDDVLSELDSRRQNYLMNTIGGIQTMITCTGLDEFVNNRFEMDQLYQIEGGQVVGG